MRRFGGLEAGAHDDDVDGAGDAVLADDLVGGERGHRRIDDLDVRQRERGVVVVGQQKALAAGLVVRCELGAQRLVGDLLAQVVEGALADHSLGALAPTYEDPEQ